MKQLKESIAMNYIRKTIAYIIGQYNSEYDYEKLENINRATNVGKHLLKIGYMPIIPHRNTGFLGGITNEDLFYNGYLTILEKTADLCVLAGVISNSIGSCREVELALELNIPVFTNFQIIPNAEDFNKMIAEGCNFNSNISLDKIK